MRDTLVTAAEMVTLSMEMGTLPAAVTFSWWFRNRRRPPSVEGNILHHTAKPGWSSFSHVKSQMWFTSGGTTLALEKFCSSFSLLDYATR